MPLLKISKKQSAGEYCWSVNLIDDGGKDILRSTEPMVKGIALSTAKTMKYKGPDAPFIEVDALDPSRPAWTAEKIDGRWLVRFSLIGETKFDLLDLPYKLEDDDKQDIVIIKDAVGYIKSKLGKADLLWQPPEADPAYMEKESDRTPIEGHPGS